MRLQLEISHLREDEFKKSFQSTLNPFCNCGCETETTTHR